MNWFEGVKLHLLRTGCTKVSWYFIFLASYFASTLIVPTPIAPPRSTALQAIAQDSIHGPPSSSSSVWGPIRNKNLRESGFGSGCIETAWVWVRLVWSRLDVEGFCGFFLIWSSPAPDAILSQDHTMPPPSRNNKRSPESPPTNDVGWKWWRKEDEWKNDWKWEEEWGDPGWDKNYGWREQDALEGPDHEGKEDEDDDVQVLEWRKEPIEVSDGKLMMSLTPKRFVMMNAPKMTLRPPMVMMKAPKMKLGVIGSHYRVRNRLREVVMFPTVHSGWSRWMTSIQVGVVGSCQDWWTKNMCAFNIIFWFLTNSSPTLVSISRTWPL